MTWGYRLVKIKNEERAYYQISEVYFNKKGEPIARTQNGVTFGVGNDFGVDELSDEEAVKSIEKSLTLALNDIKKHPIFEDPEKWADWDEE